MKDLPQKKPIPECQPESPIDDIEEPGIPKTHAKASMSAVPSRICSGQVAMTNDSPTTGNKEAKDLTGFRSRLLFHPKWLRPMSGPQVPLSRAWVESQRKCEPTGTPGTPGTLGYSRHDAADALNLGEQGKPYTFPWFVEEVGKPMSGLPLGSQKYPEQKDGAFANTSLLLERKTTPGTSKLQLPLLAPGNYG